MAEVLKVLKSKTSESICVGSVDLKFTEEQADLKTAIVGAQLVRCKTDYWGSSVTQFGLAECRLQMAGCYNLICVKHDDAPGEGMVAKLENIANMNTKEIMTLVQDIGSAVRVEEGSMVTIPAGMLVVMRTGTDPIMYLRWSLYSKADKSPATETMRSLLQAHSFLHSTDYKVMFDLVSD